ncbi:ADP-ribosylation factor-like 6 interacting protein 1 isoform X2 [Choristoneura fumiferana]|uniref:ADP-ribosylation factor-like 6 interacting protein 1 isoform X2 n=1 Tax=Choristoneura fumiferana TaxID=7141 RepID=UPI003D158876
MVDVLSQVQEQQVKKVKRLLEGWRLALIPMRSIILWEQQWYPAAIVGALTFLYTFIWLMDSNFLTTFAMVGIILNFVDFIIPIICTSLYGPSYWTGQKEKMFEDICRSIVVHYNKIVDQVGSFTLLRETSPCMYYIITISMLCTLAWVSSVVNNIFLLYVASVAMLLWPGIQHRGILNTLLAMINMAPKPKSLKPE